jgi:thiosulfate reductase cytochrome b subunit
LIIALGFGISVAFAKSDYAATQTASPMHPTFAMLDKDGTNVLESGQAASTMKTCGQCHDAEYIVKHAYHADLGLSDYKVNADSWNTSNGLFGKFDPISYRYLSPTGDERLDLTTPDWLKTYGWRVPGGGPAVVARDGQPLTSLSPDAKNPESSTYNAASGSFDAWDWNRSGVIEMNCFLCHMETPNDTMRVSAIERGNFGWANSATLVGTGILDRSSLGVDGYAWNKDAFDADGKLKSEYVKLGEPTNANCAACHGEIHEDPINPVTITACDVKQTQTATTGQVIASQKISESGVNISGKDNLTYAWDIHAERALKCTDCHYSLNNPAHQLDTKAGNPDWLTYDPRKLEVGEYLKTPNHNFARGDSAQFTVSPATRSTMRRCESCHDTTAAHAGFLPYNDRHMQVVACETCHIPKINAPALRTVDWTAIKTDGSALIGCRGIDGTNTTTDLVTGYQPVLMQRTDVDGKTLLAPYNLVTSFFWVYEDANGNTRPVRKSDLEAAYLVDGTYTADIVAAFDANTDGVLSDKELELDTTAKQALIQGKLETLGLKNVHIYGQVQPYSINHDVVNGDYATRECSTCHGDNSRITSAIALTASGPTGVTPVFVTDSNVSVSGTIVNANGTLLYQPANENDNTYVFGHNRIGWIDWFGAIAFIATLLGVAGHGTLRYMAAGKQGKHESTTKPVYMYEVYERFWHWLQTIGIVTLLLTGLVIHRPDLFSAFSFRYIVTIHNVLAALLAINAALSLFYHLVSGEIRQYLPHPRGFIDDAITQALYYIKGIFKNEQHPFAKTKDRKLNPLQQVTYFALLNVLLPLQGITGILMWLVQKVPAIQTALGGLPLLAPFHTLTAWLFATFIVGHVYLTTTAGPKPLDGIQAMVTGWEDMEVHE